MDYNITARIWDSFFVEGEAYAMKVSLGILKYYEMELRLSTFDEAIKILKNIPMETNEERLFQLINNMQLTNPVTELVAELVIRDSVR